LVKLVLANMDPQLHRETENLVKSWTQYEPDMLKDYLVSGVEDPRINVQSILTRHFLTVALFGSEFETLMESELRFATVLNWANQVFGGAGEEEDLQAIEDALTRGSDNAEGIPIPRFVAAAYRSLPATLRGMTVPNYLQDLLHARRRTGELSVSDEVLATFELAWRIALADQPASRAAVLEAACGSANDYRFLESYGLARLVEYTGFDLCETNVRNARKLFPGGRFVVGNAFALAFPNATFDYAIAHDLFEHLSVQAMDLALAELCRVTRKGLSLGFFNVHEDAEHLVQSTDDYHWNRLSLPRLRERLEEHGFATQVVHIDTFLRWRFGCSETHNKNAYSLFAERRG
jgi:ubiquinone/menaquinone biosynthesis C-methylase UbiE